MGAATLLNEMHKRVELMQQHCCGHTITLDVGDDILKALKSAFTIATKYLHSKKSFTPDDLKNKKVKPLITETFKALQKALDIGIKTEVPATMLAKFKEDLFLFSGMKTYAQLKEASLLLMDAEGKIKAYAKFEKDILAIDAKYNQNYLRAEYQYAVGSAQSAEQWHRFAADGDKYNLQIRTAQDDKVRASHEPLHNITLAQSDSYWHTHWTPFDWGCRCRIIQVLKSKYPVTEKDVAVAAGKKAVPALFRYNPGREQVIFPPKHPYYPQHCKGAKLDVTGLIGQAKILLDAETERCQAKNIVQEMKP